MNRYPKWLLTAIVLVAGCSIGLFSCGGYDDYYLPNNCLDQQKPLGDVGVVRLSDAGKLLVFPDATTRLRFKNSAGFNTEFTVTPDTGR